MWLIIHFDFIRKANLVIIIQNNSKTIVLQISTIYLKVVNDINNIMTIVLLNAISIASHDFLLL